MAKEVIIIFVYDTQLLQKEEDDPASAILYFHPTWVSDQQKTALCGQIIGTTRCIKSIFSTPSVVSLQSGKFYVIENGRYLLACGTDRNISEWQLEHRAKTLYSIINFFHNDFSVLSQIYPKRENLSAKLYHMFETYLKMLVYGGNIFSHIPTLALPKSASNVFTEALHLLQCCQELTNVLGGSMLYHNKVVATQFSPDLTKRIVLTDPYRIKCPAETTTVNFDLPLGVQLLEVYISSDEYYTLLAKNSSIFQYLYNKKGIKKTNSKPSTDSAAVSQMKRDQSLIFTMVPEEDAPNPEGFLPTAAKKPRPKFLNLKSASVDLDLKPPPKTPFVGQTSVVSTPMVELKKFVHQNPLSIVLDPDEVGIKVDSPEQQQQRNIDDDDKKCKGTIREHSVSLQNLAGIVDDDGDSKDKLKRAVSIGDPTCAVFSLETGKVMSKSMYNEQVFNQIRYDLNMDVKREHNNFNKFDLIMPSNKIKNNAKVEVYKNNKNITNPKSDVILRDKPKTNNREQRKSLTLPLKSLTAELTSPITKNRKYSSGVQLTPLMSKLTMLAFEEASSGFGSHSTTPGDYRGATPTQQNFPYNPIKTVKPSKANSTLHKCVLFVCGQQDVVLTLLLKEECCTSDAVINRLWEIATEHLGRLEKQLRLCMESQPNGNSAHDPYSYIMLDSDWDTLKRGGPWGTTDTVMNTLHRDFKETPGLTDIFIRGSDSVVYGNSCGQTEVYYHETAPLNGGLPPPADPMGQVQLKARRRLERDHAIVLL
ncbi:unnamed protein product [Brassicogethes aeneus]|uniref:Hermansky-Pudlak syndrome 4 protein n=1 Tax=Brassicogethes aeneus TaxID=1431903 RepID=A0A9P0AR94_BRAAE|nr:unnamed protein product [Brassicogethes aeneus]